VVRVLFKLQLFVFNDNYTIYYVIPELLIEFDGELFMFCDGEHEITMAQCICVLKSTMWGVSGDEIML
jgi:hypothetical protein